MTRLIAFAALSFGLSAGLVPLVRSIARRRNWLVARPVSDRWHRRAVPKVGGLAMLAALAPLAFVSAATPELSAVLLLSSLMFSIGVIDDIRPITPATKITAQTGAALVFLFVASPLHLTGVSWLDVGLSLIWLVGITNAFNVVDNIDGLAGGLAVIFGVFALAGPMGGPSPSGVAIGLAAMAGAAAGFLVYNWHPASVFMGDSGSHLLGSFIAGTTLLSVAPVGRLEPAGAFAVLLLLPIADLLVVSVTRGLAGRSPLKGGVDHLSHRLVALGMNDRDAVITLCALTSAGGLIAVVMGYVSPVTAWSLAGAYAASIVAVAVYAGRIKIARRPAPAAQSPRTSARVPSGKAIAASTRARARRPNPVL